MATKRSRASQTDIGDAAWAYNRWPTIGLWSGGGIGLLLSVLFGAGWLLVIGSIAGGAIGGCLLGVLLAVLVYPTRGAYRDTDATDPGQPGEPPSDRDPEPRA
ncbi:MAG: hypothetical protein ACYS0D_10195 [Planctomycetota bacterium]|jgi:hypothetical protein